MDKHGNYIRRKNKYPSMILRNPFYLGSVIVDYDLIGATRFKVGKKEDWKFWMEILKKRPGVHKVEDTIYYYTIKSSVNHVRRKMLLLKDQYHFYHRYLQFSHFISIMLCILHYSSLAVSWLVSAIKIHIRSAFR